MLSRRELANAIRALSMDAVQRANIGHPGAPMGMADLAEVLWNDFLIHNPANPDWPNRDRFVMSNGHGSMLMYSLLHLSGYELSMDDIRDFRQLHSRTPGHPEFGYTPGIETTTGPLGQGLANAVGMALAERLLANQFNQPNLEIVNHHTYVSVGDGCLMEGISHEASSLAGTLGLGKLIALYDDNNISIDGEVGGWFSEDVPARFEAYGWHVIRNVDGHDAEQVKDALEKARAESEKPSLICCKTTIGWGSPNKQGKESSHGAPLGEDEVALVRENIGWDYPPFEIPDAQYKAWDAKERGQQVENEWQQVFKKYENKHPQLAEEFKRRISGTTLPQNWDQTCEDYLQDCVTKAGKIASRKASQNALNAYAPVLPELFGGSADLSGSNLTAWSGSRWINHGEEDGNYLSYGVREFAMVAINNGMALHGGFIPYGGTFLIFSDYARNALRMAALMKQRNISVFSHDSIGLGEDGPTHQAVEQAASLRLIPNMSVWRPCDAVETAVAWRAAIENENKPTSLLLSRQGLPNIEREEKQIANIQRGAYTLLNGTDKPEVIIIATGSEVSIALEAAGQFEQKGHHIRVVSMPSTDTFDAQDESYRNEVLPNDCRKRIAIEAGSPDLWRKYVGLDGAVLGVNRFGESAPGPEVYEHFGITVDGLCRMLEEFF
ncbi:MAG: transketolase [Gammaproteobacteria bacterium]|nr:transketolase [Gammaproteobacteria bacterium]